MQSKQLIWMPNARWVAIFGGLAGGGAGAVVQWRLSTLSSGRAAFVVWLLTIVFFLSLVVVANWTGVLPTTAHNDEAAEK